MVYLNSIFVASRHKNKGAITPQKAFASGVVLSHLCHLTGDVRISG
jgi:hypothetical protein